MGSIRIFTTALAAGLLLPAIQASIPQIPGFTLTWSDDFVGTAGSTPNPADWIIDTGTSYPGGPAHWGTGELQTYTSSPDNLRLDGNGNLAITAVRNGASWTSARIETQRTDFAAKPGGVMRIQASINLPNVGGDSAGYWAAFWTLGAEYRGNFQNWPGVGEFDIMENVNGANEIWGTLHCGSSPGGPCSETTGRGGSMSGCPGSSCQGSFHTYTLEVDRTGATEVMRWFVDDRQYWQVSSADLDAATWQKSVHNGHFLLLNVAMGGAFPNGVHGGDTPLANTASGGTMLVEYVAVYNK